MNKETIKKLKCGCEYKGYDRIKKKHTYKKLCKFHKPFKKYLN